MSEQQGAYQVNHDTTDAGNEQTIDCYSRLTFVWQGLGDTRNARLIPADWLAALEAAGNALAAIVERTARVANLLEEQAAEGRLVDAGYLAALVRLAKAQAELRDHDQRWMQAAREGHTVLFERLDRERTPLLIAAQEALATLRQHPAWREGRSRTP